MVSCYFIFRKISPQSTCEEILSECGLSRLLLLACNCVSDDCEKTENNSKDCSSRSVSAILFSNLVTCPTASGPNQKRNNCHSVKFIKLDITILKGSDFSVRTNYLQEKLLLNRHFRHISSSGFSTKAFCTISSNICKSI